MKDFFHNRKNNIIYNRSTTPITDQTCQLTRERETGTVSACHGCQNVLKLLNFYFHFKFTIIIVVDIIVVDVANAELVITPELTHGIRYSKICINFNYLF